MVAAQPPKSLCKLFVSKSNVPPRWLSEHNEHNPGSCCQESPSLLASGAVEKLASTQHFQHGDVLLYPVFSQVSETQML